VNALIQIEEGDQSRTIEMVADSQGTSRLALDSVTSPFKYRVVAGKLTSPTYAITVAHPPRVTRIDLEYAYPASLGLTPRSEADGGDIYAPSGTDVRVLVHTDQPAASGQMSAVAPRGAGERRADGAVDDVPIAGDDSYRLSARRPRRFVESGRHRNFIRALETGLPDPITKPAGDRSVTRLEEVDIEVQADDDYGVERLGLYAVRGATEKSVALDVPLHATSVTARQTLYLEDLDVAPGDFVSYYARARDVTRGKRSNEARSDIFFLEVRPYEQEFSLAASQSMAGSGYSGALDELVNGQRQVVVATWKLNRRPRTQKARSDRDIPAPSRRPRPL
jgi:hypothetical protein